MIREADRIFIQPPSIEPRRHASTMMSGVGPQQVTFHYFFTSREDLAYDTVLSFFHSFHFYELFAFGMEQLMEQFANHYSPELGLRCRPCCFS